MRRLGFVKTVLYGIGAGVIAGLLVLGPGLRLAMRVVAIQDPSRTTEFTAGGTLFIVVFFGMMVGGSLGVSGAIADRYLPRIAALAIMTVLGMGFVMADSEIIEEFFELGWGPWMNIPMFALVFVGYSRFALWFVDRWQRDVASSPIKEKVSA